MAVFPTLSVNPSVEPWKEGAAFDPTIRSQQEGGYVLTRARVTRIPSKWEIGYYALPSSDKNSIRTFEMDCKVGSDIFTWTNPTDNITYDVRFLNPVSYKMHETAFLWDVEFTLEQV